MSRHVIDAVVASAVAESILVVTREPDLLSHIQREQQGVALLHQPGHALGLNAAIDLGRREALARSADRLLVLSADLPLLTSGAVLGFVSDAAAANVVLGTDAAGVGTNALLLAGEPVMSHFAFHFGLDSRRRHRHEAERLGATWRDRCVREIARDLDTPEDWGMLSGEIRHSLLVGRAGGHRPPPGVATPDPVAYLERA
jgi:2-phospho-L-lactate guanylyltransferase